MTIGDKIKYHRKSQNLTQDKLAELANLHPVSIRKYETNKMKPKIEQLFRIAIALDVPPCTLCFCNKEEK